jgi:hypothetical protein
LNACRSRHYKRLADKHVAAGTADLTDVLANLTATVVLRISAPRFYVIARLRLDHPGRMTCFSVM